MLTSYLQYSGILNFPKEREKKTKLCDIERIWAIKGPETLPRTLVFFFPAFQGKVFRINIIFIIIYLTISLKIKRGDLTMKVQVVGRICPDCDKVYEMTKNAMSELGLSEEVERITETKEIMKRFHMIHIPAIVVNGKVVLSGHVPPEEKVKKALSQVKEHVA
jgi:small redox-active disulfide protein 2